MIRVEHLISCILIVAMIGVSIYGVYSIPTDSFLPIHWGVNGEADHYVSRNIGLMLTPAIGAIVSLVFAAVPFVDPRRENVVRSAGLYYASWLGSLCVIFIIHVMIVLSAAQALEPNPYMVLMLACFLVIVIGNYMTKSRSSWFIGVRTPWSLTSERAWIAANRATGWLFVVSGIIAGVAAVSADAQMGFAALAAGLPSSALIGVAISYEAWRQDPKRTQ